MIEIEKNETAGHSAWDIDQADISLMTSQLMALANSVIWQHTQRILSEIKKNKKEGIIKSIEIGSDLAKLSCLIGLWGGQTTLLESSHVTLKNAEKLAKHLELQPEIQCANALSLPESVIARYDLAVSVGLNEHFVNMARQQIFDAHYQVLNRGGWVLISVPNRHCISYRLAMQGYKWTNRWPKDLIEDPFTREELQMRMERAGFKEIDVWSGSVPRDDFRFFVITNLKAVIRKILKMRRKERYVKQIESKDLRNAVCRNRQFNPFVNNQSYSWLAIGQRI